MMLTLDGRPVSEIGPWGLGEWTTDTQGPEALAWQMRPGRPHPLLKPGKLVRLYDGPTCVWAGLSNRPERATGKVTARGLALKAYDVPAIDNAGAVTLNTNTAVDEAIARGALPWIRDTSLSTTPVSTDTATLDDVPTIGQLLDAIADEQSKWWRVTPDQVVELYDRPTTPQWLITAAAGTLDVVEGDYASRLYGRRRTSTGGFATEYVDDTAAEALTGYAEDTTDLTPLGYITAGKAQSILTGMLAKGRARLQFANSVAGSRWQVLSIGGVPAHLPAVAGGQLARFMVQHDETRYLQGRGYVDELLGRVVHPAGDTSVVELQPNGLRLGADWLDVQAYMASKKVREK